MYVKHNEFVQIDKSNLKPQEKTWQRYHTGLSASFHSTRMKEVQVIYYTRNFCRIHKNVKLKKLLQSAWISQSPELEYRVGCTDNYENCSVGEENLFVYLHLYFINIKLDKMVQ